MRFLTIILLFNLSSATNFESTGNNWISMEKNEKLFFLEGFFVSQITLNKYLQDAIKYDSSGDPYWQKPFVLVMYEQNLKEFSSSKIGINTIKISDYLDAFYQDSQNIKIPIVEAIRIISLRADGNNERADWFILKNLQN